MNLDHTAPLDILVVEDDPDTLQTLSEQIDFLGHRVSSVSSAELALQLLAKRNFDILLTDINLPGMSGIALARQAWKGAQEMKIVFVSSNDSSMLSYVNFPASWLAKPYEFPTLVQTLSHTLHAA